MKIRTGLRGMMIAWLVCSGSAAAIAQDSTQVLVRAKATATDIRLRWAVSSPAAWMLSNKHGYKIERYTVMRDSVLLPVAERKVIAESLKPQPLSKWVSVAQSDNYAAIITQALYGETFEMDAGNAGGISSIVNQSTEQEQRYYVALYAADHSFQAACMAGLGVIDADVRKGERYLYRITPLTPASTLVVERGAAYLGIDDREDLPKPQGLSAQFGDHSVMLVWDFRMLQNVYGSYYVEKSENNRQFRRITHTPLSNTEDRNGNPLPRIYYIDSLAENHKPYYYRVTGIDAFGDAGAPSDTVKGEGVAVLRYMPQITGAVTDDSGMLMVEWEFAPEGEPLIKGFDLQRSDNSAGAFATVIESIPPSQRRIGYDKLQSVNYFRIVAIPHKGEPRTGFPVLVQPVDSVPPLPPAGLHGYVDSLGAAHLSWTANTEADLYGYRIYRALTAGEELLPLNDEAVRLTEFTDTLSLKMLNAKAYYAISALDQRYNQSPLSPVCVLTKPDVIPPTSPVITGYEVSAGGITLSWVCSPEPDVTQHILYRKTHDAPEIAFVSRDTLTRYCDTAVAPQTLYRYYMEAVDSAGLHSPPSPVVAVRSAARTNGVQTVDKLTVKALKAKQCITLAWTHHIAGVKTFLIYRAVGDEMLTLWKSADGSELTITDDAPQMHKQHRYAIRPVLPDGSYGEMLSREVKYN